MNDTQNEHNNHVERQLVKVDVRAIAHGEDVEIETYDGRRIWANVTALKSILPGIHGATPVELAAFLAFCQSAKLDPFRRQVHFIKYKKDEPAAWVTSWEVFMDRAQRCVHFDGIEAGIVWRVDGKKVLGQPCDYPQDEQHEIIGGWARVFRKDRQIPVYEEVPLGEMAKTTKEGRPTRFWASGLTTMCKKVPKARALRQAFPEELAGLFTEDEPRVLAPEISSVSEDVPPREERESPAQEAPAESAQVRFTAKVHQLVNEALPLLNGEVDDVAIDILPNIAFRATGESETDWREAAPWTTEVCEKCLADLEANGLDRAWLPSEEPQEAEREPS